MPRTADARLEGRILDAAYDLWQKKGRHGLTMRAVARAAGTTTPTLYERFRDKEELLAVMGKRARLKLYSTVKEETSIIGACRKGLDFFTAHPHEFQLISEDWARAFALREPMPSFEFLKERLADRLGGKPEDHISVALGIAALVNGAAAMLRAAEDHGKVRGDLRNACLAACETLVAASEKKGRRGRRRRRMREAA